MCLCVLLDLQQQPLQLNFYSSFKGIKTQRSLRSLTHHSFIHSFNKCLVRTFWMLKSIQGIETIYYLHKGQEHSSSWNLYSGCLQYFFECHHKTWTGKFERQKLSFLQFLCSCGCNSNTQLFTGFISPKMSFSDCRWHSSCCVLMSYNLCAPTVWCL